MIALRSENHPGARAPGPPRSLGWWGALLVALLLLPAAPAAAAPAPGGPGEKAIWTEADKDGFGTAHNLRSKVWHTLDDGRMSEVYYPDLGTPAVRELELVVSDGRTFSEREQDSTRQRIELLDPEPQPTAR